MYLIGAAHPHKTEAQVILERLTAAGERLVTDAGMLQGMLHRYTSINRRVAIGPALRVTLAIVDEGFPIEKAEGLRAGGSTPDRPSMASRRAAHIPVMG